MQDVDPIAPVVVHARKDLLNVARLTPRRLCRLNRLFAGAIPCAILLVALFLRRVLHLARHWIVVRPIALAVILLATILVLLLALARGWDQARRFHEMALHNRGRTMTELAIEAGVGGSYFTRILRLSFLAPDGRAYRA